MLTKQNQQTTNLALCLQTPLVLVISMFDSGQKKVWYQPGISALGDIIFFLFYCTAQNSLKKDN